MKILSAAKINLTLEIVGKRSDGYHDLATWMLPIGLYDTLEIEVASTSSFTSNVPELTNDSSNLVVRATEVFNRCAGTGAAYNMRLEKQIPIGAGLGGGSSNAAATLLALNQLHGLPLSAERLREVGATLGSDVVFFLKPGSAWCTSRGEVTESREFPGGYWIFLAKPAFGISTALAYKAYAALSPERRKGMEIRTEWGTLRNDLEQAVFPKYLLLPVIKNWLLSQSHTIVSLMSGSGSTTFAVVKDRSQGESLRNAFQGAFGARVWTAVCSLNASSVFE